MILKPQKGRYVKIGFNLGILHRYIVRLLIPSFLVSLFLFTFFVEILDITTNLIRYLFNDVPIMTILQIQWLYLPTSFAYALPVAILFSVSFTMSNLYSNNELISVYAAGISLFKFVLPFIVLGIVLSAGNYFFKEKIEINSLREKTNLVRDALNQDLGNSQDNVSVLEDGGKIVYHANFYNANDKRLSGVSIIESDEKNNLILRIDAESARWNGDRWIFEYPQIFYYDKDNKIVDLDLQDSYSSSKFDVDPKNFESVINRINEMQAKEAFEYVKVLKENGLPYRRLLAQTYARIPLSISPLIVMLIACFAANAYGKNTFLMSLLLSLISAVVYYSADLMGSVLASRLIIPPLVGAWLGVITTITASFLLYKFTAK